MSLPNTTSADELARSNKKFRYDLTTSLIKAIVSNNDEKVINLLKKGANPNTVNSRLEVNILSYCIMKNHNKVVSTFLTFKANPNLVNPGSIGFSPLMYAIPVNLRAFQLLVKSGANLNFQTEERYTPLYFIAKARKLNLLQFVLEHGADPNQHGYEGITPLMQSAEGDIVGLKLLLKYKAKTEITDDLGFTALIYACGLRTSSSTYEVVTCLLGAGSKPTEATINGYSVLHAAALSCPLNIVKLLIEKGANPQAIVVGSNNTVLMEAVRGGRVTVVKYLMSLGIDKTIKDRQGRTAYDLAVKNGNTHLANALE